MFSVFLTLKGFGKQSVPEFDPTQTVAETIRAFHFRTMVETWCVQPKCALL